MNPRMTLDSLLAVIAVAFGAVCAAALLITMTSDPLTPADRHALAFTRLDASGLKP